jgi:hypothetical protein
MPPSPGSSSAEGTGARPSPDLRVCSSRSQSRSPAWDTMARWSGRPGLPISICGRIAPLGEREPPSECERATSKVPPAKEGGSRCHRSGRRRIRRQASLARRANRSRRRRPLAGSNRGRSRPAASSIWWPQARSRRGWPTNTIGLQNRRIPSATTVLSPTRRQGHGRAHVQRAHCPSPRSPRRTHPRVPTSSVIGLTHPTGEAADRDAVPKSRKLVEDAFAAEVAAEPVAAAPERVAFGS